jgi:hypothetical protein
MKLLALLVAFQTAFLFSVATTPTADEAAAALAPAAAAPALDAPTLVHLEEEIVVRR